MFTIYDCTFDIHHFYRHESSLEKRIIDLLKKSHGATSNRLRIISYFHLQDSAELRFQSSMKEEELESALKSIRAMREITSARINVATE